MKAILCKVDIAKDCSFSITQDVQTSYYNQWHYHPEIELTLIKRGRGTRLVGDSMEEYDDGDIVLLGSNLPHLLRPETTYFAKHPTGNTEVISIYFDENFWGNGLGDMPELKAIRELFEKAKRGIKLKGKTRLQVQKKIDDILSSNGIKRMECLLNLLVTIATSSYYTVLASTGFLKTYNTNPYDKINSVYLYTLNNFQKKISIKEVAILVNLTPHSFCRYFKTRTLKTYWEFLSEIRVGYACKLLIENKLTISQICYESGFHNLSNFNRCFKATLNKTPHQFFKEYAQNNMQAVI